MSSRTRNQEYRYQYKNVAVAKSFFCGRGPTMRVSVPDNLLDIKAIFVHAVLRFDADVPQSRRKIHYLGGTYKNKYYDNPDPTDGSMIHVDVEADPVTRIADCKIDITRLKKELMDAIDFDSIEQPSMELTLDTSNGLGEARGDVILWKVDLAYTTTGIQ